jgi:hypothetical protein
MMMFQPPVGITSRPQYSIRRVFTQSVRRQLHDGPGIQTWQDACRKVPHAQILPASLGGYRNQKFQGFVGDKLLGAAAARVLEETILAFRDKHMESNSSPLNALSVDEGCASALCSIALSNRFLHTHAELLLPDHCIELTRRMGDHGVGTMVEAAVAAVD